MSTDDAIEVRGIHVQVVRKAIKNLHLGVYPPYGKVRVAAPLAVSNQAVRLAVIEKLAWIARQRANFQRQPRMSKRELVSGESHYFLGRRFRLRLIEQDGMRGYGVRLTRSHLELVVRSNSTPAHRETLLNDWYRAQLRSVASSLIGKWQARLGVEVSTWGIRKMKTKWGACNPDSRRIWLNLELAKAPLECVEYIVLHELAHLLVRHHNEGFQALMDANMSGWRERRTRLTSVPLTHVLWPC
jgi:predicted metal-dependent hydrolase